MLRSLALWCYRRRRVVLALWLLVLIACMFAGRTIGGAYSESLRLPGTESQKAADLLDKEFQSKAGDSGQLVVAAPDVRAAVVKQRVAALVADIAQVPGVADVVSPYS